MYQWLTIGEDGETTHVLMIDNVRSATVWFSCIGKPVWCVRYASNEPNQIAFPTYPTLEEAKRAAEDSFIWGVLANLSQT